MNLDKTRSNQLLEEILSQKHDRKHLILSISYFGRRFSAATLATTFAILVATCLVSACSSGKKKHRFESSSEALTEYHDEFAKVNEPWGLARGTDISLTGAHDRPTEEYRRHLDELCATKEEELSNLGKALSSIKMEIAVAERRIKGLSTMVSNLEKERSERIQEITLLKEQIASQEGDSTLLNATLSRLQKELAEVNDKLADKQSKLDVADRKLEDLKMDML